LASDKKYYVRCAVAENPNCPPEILNKLAADENYNVRRAVAVNPKCPENLKIEMLLSDMI
jgi:hypothetical protein